jgi:hypothetical protein
MLTATKHGLGRLSSAGVSEQYLLQFADPVSAKSFEKAFNEAKVSCEAQNVVDNCSFFTTEGLAYRGSKDFSAAVAEDCAPWAMGHRCARHSGGSGLVECRRSLLTQGARWEGGAEAIQAG